MMAINNKKKFDLSLECALCNKNLIYNQSKTLPCLHTFCTSCLTRITGDTVQQFTPDVTTHCPVCHVVVNTENLKLDVIMEKLLYVRHLQQSKRYCEMCITKGKEGVVSTHWCLECKKFLCDPCLFHHEIYKPTDTVIAVSHEEDFEKVSNFILPPKCSCHKENLKEYCSQCKICLCLSCCSEHDSHRMDPIEQVTPVIKSQGQNLLGKINSHLEKENQKIEDMKLKIDNLNTEHSNKATEIWGHVEETVEILKKNAHTFIKEMEAVTKREINELEKLVQLRQYHVKEMEIINNNFHQLLQSFGNIDILLNYSRLESKSKNLLMKPTEKFTSNFVNMEYNKWYLELREMCKTQPLGHCRAGTSSLTKGLYANMGPNKQRLFSMPTINAYAAYDNTDGPQYDLNPHKNSYF